MDSIPEIFFNETYFNFTVLPNEIDTARIEDPISTTVAATTENDHGKIVKTVTDTRAPRDRGKFHFFELNLKLIFTFVSYRR